MPRARSALLALGAAAAVLVGACATPGPSAAPPPEPPAAPPAGLAELYGQPVAFEPCAPYATTAIDAHFFASDRFDCARVQVPLDYADPDGPRGQVALLRAKARGERIGSLLVNPGGPGASGMSIVATQGAVWDSSPVGERFDVIGFDPRGVGASTPRVDCFSDAELDRGTNPSPYLFEVPDAQAAAEVARRCAEGTGGVPALTSVGSSAVVRDMDLLRAALGDQKINYLGYSYGSELGGMYAQAFPRNVRAMVIDGAVDPAASETDFRLGQFAAFQRSFDRMAAACAARPDCPLGTDPARATQAFQDIVRPLRDRPVPTADGRQLDHGGVLEVMTTGALWVESQWPLIIQGLGEVRDGRGDALTRVRDIMFGRGPDGRYGGVTNLEANLATRCMDNPRRGPEEQLTMLRAAYAAAPFLDPGTPVDQVHYECEAWPAPVSRTLPWLTGGVDLPPTLTISVTGDPGTPHAGGVEMARRLGGSLLTVDGAQHGIALTGQSPCVDAVAEDYLINLRTPPADAGCSL